MLWTDPSQGTCHNKSLMHSKLVLFCSILLKETTSSNKIMKSKFVILTELITQSHVLFRKK